MRANAVHLSQYDLARMRRSVAPPEKVVDPVQERRKALKRASDGRKQHWPNALPRCSMQKASPMILAPIATHPPDFVFGPGRR